MDICIDRNAYIENIRSTLRIQSSRKKLTNIREEIIRSKGSQAKYAEEAARIESLAQTCLSIVDQITISNNLNQTTEQYLETILCNIIDLLSMNMIKPVFSEHYTPKIASIVNSICTNQIFGTRIKEYALVILEIISIYGDYQLISSTIKIFDMIIIDLTKEVDVSKTIWNSTFLIRFTGNIVSTVGIEVLDRINNIGHFFRVLGQLFKMNLRNELKKNILWLTRIFILKSRKTTYSNPHVSNFIQSIDLFHWKVTDLQMRDIDIWNENTGTYHKGTTPNETMEEYFERMEELLWTISFFCENDFNKLTVNIENTCRVVINRIENIEIKQYIGLLVVLLSVIIRLINSSTATTRPDSLNIQNILHSALEIQDEMIRKLVGKILIIFITNSQDNFKCGLDLIERFVDKDKQLFMNDLCTEFAILQLIILQAKITDEEGFEYSDPQQINRLRVYITSAEFSSLYLDCIDKFCQKAIKLLNQKSSE